MSRNGTESIPSEDGYFGNKINRRSVCDMECYFFA